MRPRRAAGSGGQTRSQLAGAALSLLLGLCAAGPARAGLGDAASAAAADGRVVFPTQRFDLGGLMDLAGTPVWVTTVRRPFGVVVREFSGKSGVVFAMAWAGRGLPRLDRLYGRYFPAYLAWVLAHPSPGDDPWSCVRTASIVGHVEGSLGGWVGSAYVPALVPHGVDLSSLGVQP